MSRTLFRRRKLGPLNVTGSFKTSIENRLGRCFETSKIPADKPLKDTKAEYRIYLGGRELRAEEEEEEGRICARTSTAGLVSFCPTNLSLSLWAKWNKGKNRMMRQRRGGSESAPRIKAWKGAAARSSGTRRRDSFQKRRINSRLFDSNHRDLDRWAMGEEGWLPSFDSSGKYNYNRRNETCMCVYRVSR